MYLSDRVLVLQSDPGTVRAEVPVALDRPRRRDDDAAPAFTSQVRQALQAAHAF